MKLILFIVLFLLIVNSFINCQSTNNNNKDGSDNNDDNNGNNKKDILDQNTLNRLLKLTETVIKEETINNEGIKDKIKQDEESPQQPIPPTNKIKQVVINGPEKIQKNTNDEFHNQLNKQHQAQQQHLLDQQQKQKQKQQQLKKQFLEQILTFNQNDFLFGSDFELIDKKSKSTISDNQLPGRSLIIDAQKNRGYLLYDQHTSTSSSTPSSTHRYSNSIMVYNFDQSDDRDIFEFVGETPITTIDPLKAYQLLLDSANNFNNHRAMYLLGSMNEIGEHNNGIMNFTLAEEWYLKASEFGNSDAQRSLGFLYATGKLGYIDEAKAVLYYTFSARSGNIVSQLTMAYRYLYGHGVEKNCKKSSVLYLRVAEKVVKDYELRGFGYNIHSERLSEEYQKKTTGYASEESDILEFFKYSAEMGDIASLITMARLSLEGNLMTQDYRQALDYFKQAIEHGEEDHTVAEGYAGLGFMYSKGYGVEQNNETAVSYYLKAVNSGDRDTRWRLAYHYFYGIGVDQNIKKAIDLLNSVVSEMIVTDEEGGQIKLPPVYEALTLLGKIYAYSQQVGSGITIDRTKASHYLLRAIAGGDVEANYHFARIHLENDESTCPVVIQHLKKVAEKGPWSMLLSSAQELYDESDIDRALLLNEKAAEMGIEMAQYNSGWMYDKQYGLSPYLKSDQQLESDSGSQDQQDEPINIYISDEFNQEFFTQQAFRLFFNSAEQQNALSHIKIGDYFYYGIGVEKNLESAAESYKVAANLYHPQALFNLGYIYEFGKGVPQDLYLAKRYYDMSLTIKPEQNKQGHDGYYGYIPVYISLIGLLFHFIYLYIASFFDSSISISSSSSSSSNNNLIQPPPTTATISNSNTDTSYSSSFINELMLENDLISNLESYLITIVAIIIVFLFIRRQRIIGNQQRNNDNNNNPNAHPIQ